MTMNSNSKRIVARWMLFSMLGLAAGMVTATLLDKPLDKVLGAMLVTPVLTFTVGAVLGTSQWLQLRSLIEHTKLWIVATSIGLGIGLALGVVTVEGVGRLLMGHRPNLFHLSVLWRAVSFAGLGSISGFCVGASQWLIVLRRRGPSPSWIAMSAASLAIGFSLSSLIIDGVVGGIGSAPGLISFVLLSGAIFGLGTARPLTQTA